MKKILIVTSNLLIGGVTTSLINIANALAQQNYFVQIITASSEVSDGIINQFDKKIKIVIKDEKKFPLLNKAVYFRNFYESGAWFTRKTPKYLYKYYVGKEKYDIEIAFYIARPAKIIAGSTNEHSKKILWIRTDLEKNTGWSAGFRNGNDAIEGFKIFNKIICVSSQAKQSFIKRTGINENVVVMHNLMNTIRIKSLMNEACELKKEKFTIVFVGRITKEKGILELLEVCKLLNEEGNDYNLWVVGDGPLLENVKEYIEINNLYNVILLGRQLNPYKYIKNADLYVSSSYLEGYPNTIAESVYIETPVVSLRCNGVDDILDNGKYGIIVDSIKDLHKEINTMLNDNKKYMFYKQKTIERKAFFDQKKLTDNLMNEIEF